jgi:hypothetical protein
MCKHTTMLVHTHSNIPPCVCLCINVYTLNICIHVFTHTQHTLHTVCARSHLTRTQLAIHTLPAITHTSHMHSKPSATCHCSQRLKRRETLEYALRQRRDLVDLEIPAQAHTQMRVVRRLLYARARAKCVRTHSLRSMLVAHVCDNLRINVFVLLCLHYLLIQE